MSKKTNKIQPEWTYKTTISYKCPIRGAVEQEVEVKVYKSVDSYDHPISEEVAELLAQEEWSFDDLES